MPLPLLAAGLIAGSGVVSGVYNVKKALESRKYWDDYYRNTGYRSRYPFRSGYYDIVPAVSSGISAFGYGYAVGMRVNHRRHYTYRSWFK